MRELKEIVVLLFVFWIVTVTIHEYGHLTSLKLMGEEGYISSTMLDGVYPSKRLSKEKAFIFSASGSLACVIILSVLRSIEAEREEQIVMNMFILKELLYGVFEVYSYNFNWRFYPKGTLIATLGMGTIFIYEFVNLVREQN